MDDKKELETALGLQSIGVQVGAETVTVQEFSLADIPPVLTLLDKARERGVKLEQFGVEGGGSIKAETFDWLQALLRSGDLGLDLLNIATRRKGKDWFREIPLRALPELFTALLEVNTVFFQAIPQLKDRLGSLLPVSGSTTTTPADQMDIGEVSTVGAGGAGSLLS